ncbi:MAG TPA: peptidylprolyl isomerase [Acidobacteria bacterium]|uniref:peptidylprolyl isomerase n=1 Tax=marine metagenome TaxID=408172 RepID=A0A381RTW4_9ZZZZ|nr:peptidylprolyl isomerase [Acidobacteriota bacterium]
MSVRKLILLVACCIAVIATVTVLDAAAQDNPVVVIETSLGNITAELDRANAPLSVENFLEYVESGHYGGTVFHRVIEGFMIQGGGFTADMQRKPTRTPVKNEARNGLANDRGTLAMARTNAVDSATSQFFINVADNAALNNRGITPAEYGYAVFGRVTDEDSLDVVDQIEAVATGRRGPYSDVPEVPVEILSIAVQ